jgi:AcrR family transcriptional regulator
MTVDAIVKKAGVAKGTFYVHFADSIVRWQENPLYLSKVVGIREECAEYYI